MAYLLKSNDVYIDDEVIAEQDPIEFRNGRNLGSLPTLYDENWGYVESANQWFIHLKANKRLESLSSYARALLHYWNFIESEGLIWDVFPLAKGLKPTYRYRNDKLLKSIKAGELACSTANTYMTHVVQFYLWAAHERYYNISERHKPFEIEFVRIHRSDMLAHMMPKFLIQTTDLRIRTPRDATSNNIRGLKPLTQIALTHLALHLRNAPCEFRLICLLAAQCGFRIQEASGLTLAALEQSVQRSGSITHFELTIGPSDCSLKRISEETEFLGFEPRQAPE
ncbi:hypothetical protein WMQ48_12615 [Vibrio cidicii]|uniref:hypothetical protein n=1 Tax=Vibrio cidicii TaxID=1763883 RepID=UPI003752E1D8